ncbi:hypothetical protein HCJ76_44545 [Streptomyces sp. MC1]|uniref:hypothetical protein n=1 Tax=Streptomyces sp. MC1 TaxID=295105 RepID=UPI0018C8E817|nr:hypothetical protein [Streptomyces sp. MC1]MBG7704953.1 hypothetical protein [Streptomyces sp. MC1]
MNETVARCLTGLAGIATAAAFVIEVPLYFLYSGPPPDSNVLARLLIGIQARDSSPSNAPARSSGHASVWRWTSGGRPLHPFACHWNSSSSPTALRARWSAYLSPRIVLRLCAARRRAGSTTDV